MIKHSINPICLKKQLIGLRGTIIYPRKSNWQQAIFQQIFMNYDETEKGFMQLAAEKYMKKEGVLLPGRRSFTIEIGPEYGELCIGMEESSGCRYKEIHDTGSLKQCISEYIDQYVNTNACIALFYSREAMSQVAVLARIFGECREGQIPRSSAALQI